MEKGNPISLVKILEKTKKVIAKNTNAISSDEPFVTFAQENIEENIYCVKILACVPKSVKNWEILDPSDLKTNKTYLGEIDARTITISWEDDLSPFEHPQNLWYILLRYQLLDENIQDKGIRVNFQFGDPETTRGTVTTSGSGSA